MRSDRLLAVLALVSLVLAGCVQPPDVPEGEVAFETLEQGSHSGITERATEVVRTQAAWQQLWSRHTLDQASSSSGQAPPVEFNESMVLAAFKGDSPNGCHGAEIENVTGTANGTLVVEGAFFRVNGTFCTQEITQPFHIVELDRYDAEVSWQMREEVRQAPNGSQRGTGQGSEGGQADGPRRAPSDPGFETIERGPDSGVTEQGTSVVRNQTAWAQLWREHDRRNESAPAVDFDERMVVAIFKGESPNGCHGAKIENVTGNGSELVVHGVFATVEGAVCPQGVTYPFHIAETARYEGPVRFDVSHETRQA